MPGIVITPVGLVVPAAATLLHTVPAGEEQTLSMNVAGVGGADTAFSLWIVPAGEARGTQHARALDYPIFIREIRTLLDDVSLPSGCAIWVAAGAAALVTVQLTGRRRPIA